MTRAHHWFAVCTHAVSCLAEYYMWLFSQEPRGIIRSELLRESHALLIAIVAGLLCERTWKPHGSLWN